MSSFARVSMASLALLAHGAFPTTKHTQMVKMYRVTADDADPNTTYTTKGLGSDSLTVSEAAEKKAASRLHDATSLEELNAAAPAPEEKAGAPAAEERKPVAPAGAPKAPEKSDHDPVSLPALMKQEEAAIRASQKALMHYKGATAMADRLNAKKDAAEKRKEDATKAVGDALAKVHDAKGLRLEAAKVDMNIDPAAGEHAESQKGLASAEAKVATAEKALAVASKVATLADDNAEKVEGKVEKATAAQAAYAAEVKENSVLADRIAGQVAREESRLEAVVSVLKKEEDSMKAQWDEASKGLPKAPAPADKPEGEQ